GRWLGTAEEGPYAEQARHRFSRDDGGRQCLSGHRPRHFLDGRPTSGSPYSDCCPASPNPVRAAVSLKVPYRQESLPKRREASWLARRLPRISPERLEQTWRG